MQIFKLCEVRRICSNTLPLNHEYKGHTLYRYSFIYSYTVFFPSWELCVHVPLVPGDGDCRALTVTVLVLCSEKVVSVKQL